MIDALLSKSQVITVDKVTFYGKRLWVLWALIIGITLVVQLSTVNVLPAIQKDEVQITDYGRLALNPESDWSATWLLANNKPLHIWSYVGPLIAETAYRLGDGSGTSTRIASLIGGLFAATMALGWLLSRKVSPYFALLLSIAFSLDPLFILTQTLGRVDSWVVAFCLSSCWLLRNETLTTSSRIPIAVIMCAGALAAVAAFIWPSSIFLYPLILYELIYLMRIKAKHGFGLNKILLSFFYFIISSVVTVILLLIPVLNYVQLLLSDMQNVVAQNVQSSKSISDRALALFDLQLWSKMVKAFGKTLSPFLPLLGLCAVLYKRDKWLILSFLFTLALIFATLVYEYRLVYLLPYFLACSGEAFKNINAGVNSIIKRLGTISLIIIIIWAAGISLVTRTLLAKESIQLSRAKIYNAVNTSIGVGNYKVFLAYNYELYFAARSLGWHVYLPYIQYNYDEKGNWIQKDDYKPENKLRELLSKMDYAVFPKGEVSLELSDQLRQSGLIYKSTVEIGSDSKKHLQFSGRTMAIILWFLRGNESYGPYVLYARPAAAVNK